MHGRGICTGTNVHSRGGLITRKSDEEGGMKSIIGKFRKKVLFE